MTLENDIGLIQFRAPIGFTGNNQILKNSFGTFKDYHILLFC